MMTFQFMSLKEAKLTRMGLYEKLFHIISRTVLGSDPTYADYIGKCGQPPLMGHPVVPYYSHISSTKPVYFSLNSLLIVCLLNK